MGGKIGQVKHIQDSVTYFGYGGVTHGSLPIHISLFDLEKGFGLADRKVRSSIHDLECGWVGQTVRSSNTCDPLT